MFINLIKMGLAVVSIFSISFLPVILGGGITI